MRIWRLYVRIWRHSSFVCVHLATLGFLPILHLILVQENKETLKYLCVRIWRHSSFVCAHLATLEFYLCTWIPCHFGAHSLSSSHLGVQRCFRSVALRVDVSPRRGRLGIGDQEGHPPECPECYACCGSGIYVSPLNKIGESNFFWNVCLYFSSGLRLSSNCPPPILNIFNLSPPPRSRPFFKNFLSVI